MPQVASLRRSTRAVRHCVFDNKAHMSLRGTKDMVSVPPAVVCSRVDCKEQPCLQRGLLPGVTPAPRRRLLACSIICLLLHCAVKHVDTPNPSTMMKKRVTDEQFVKWAHASVTAYSAGTETRGRLLLLLDELRNPPYGSLNLWLQKLLAHSTTAAQEQLAATPYLPREMSPLMYQSDVEVGEQEASAQGSGRADGRGTKSIYLRKVAHG